MVWQRKKWQINEQSCIQPSANHSQWKSTSFIYLHTHTHTHSYTYIPLSIYLLVGERVWLWWWRPFAFIWSRSHMLTIRIWPVLKKFNIVEAKEVTLKQPSSSWMPLLLNAFREQIPGCHNPNNDNDNDNETNHNLNSIM